jgi:ABC-2 type transport system ATP-binding protein
MAKEKIIVISTHLLDEVDTVCSRAIVIAQGKIVSDGTPAALEARSELHNAVTFRLSVAQSDLGKASIEAVSNVDRVVQKSAENGSVTYIAYPTESQSIIDEISGALKAASIDVQEIQAERGRLDEVFRRITTAA